MSEIKYFNFQFQNFRPIFSLCIFLYLFFCLPILAQEKEKNADKKISDSAYFKTVLSKIQSYRMFDPNGYMVTGTITDKYGGTRKLTIYAGNDGTFVKVTDENDKKNYYGLKSQTDGLQYVDSVSQKWSASLPYISQTELNLGDLLLPSFSQDYIIVKIDTNLSTDEKIITMIPQNLNVPYGKIILHVNNEYMPLKAELFSVSGEIKHYVEYKKYKLVNKQILQSKLIFTSTIYQVDPVYVDLIEYKKMDLEDDFFSINNVSFFN